MNTSAPVMGFENDPAQQAEPVIQIAGLPALLWQRVKETPDKTAVVFDHQAITFQQLADQSILLAQYLRHLGSQNDDCVGLFADPSMTLMIGAWGILTAGAAYLPLSPEYPEERLRYMLENSRVSIIFCENHQAPVVEKLAPEGIKIITPDDIASFNAAVSKKPQIDVESIAQPHHLAYVIYTSGSTGKPKGVMIEHHSIVSQLCWMQQEFGFNEKTNVLQKTPMSFDAAQWEILSPVFGGTTTVSKPGDYRDPEALVETIIRNNVTTFQGVPTLIQAMLDTMGIHDCTSLNQVFSGGETLTKHLSSLLFETLPGCQLINLYGPTECTINSSTFVVDPDTVGKGPTAISIGKPVGDTQYYILDTDLNPVTEGKIGELYIGGVQLARGYLHRDDLTAERFIDNPFQEQDGSPKLYKTGDLTYVDGYGNYHFAGRVDNQVKLRGFRVELDEIRLAIEDHDWVKHAAMLIKEDSRTGFQNLIACIELNPKEAALMDQGNHGSHHQSKSSKLQVKAQLSNPGLRSESELESLKAISLPNKQPSDAQILKSFGRKSYRFYDGGDVTRQDIIDVLNFNPYTNHSRPLASLTLEEFGELMRMFGQFTSSERLLPKYAYASPGALYATQMYVELDNMFGFEAGIYYYHPVEHQLMLIHPGKSKGITRLQIHFIGKKSAIEPVYKNNIIEVLEMETGHMLGLFDELLPKYGLEIDDGSFDENVKQYLKVAYEDYYLGSFALREQSRKALPVKVDLFVQSHPGKIENLPGGQYHWKDGKLLPLGDELILKKHVIAINQQVYERASFGISIVSREDEEWKDFISLGRQLHYIQANHINIGTMSSGYSSKTGNDLPSAVRMRSILAEHDMDMRQFYFCIGGRITNDQRTSLGMKEDSIHMKGPTEIIKDDLHEQLPNYMVPNKVLIMNRLPLTPNGKIDYKALAESPEVTSTKNDRPFVSPRNDVEKRIADIWKTAMKWESVSTNDDFFESGGNSLIAVSLINKINAAFNVTLPMQILFEAPTIEKLAQRLEGKTSEKASRLLRLSPVEKNPVFAWPGLGGYPMNLRFLAAEVEMYRPFYGIQAFGINAGEEPYATISEMAAQDIKAIKEKQGSGPYTLWGYSFGARVAFETAYQMEQAGEQIESLFLIAPGSPKLHAELEGMSSKIPAFTNKAFVTILFSVFAQTIKGPILEACLEEVYKEDDFINFICKRFKHLDSDLVSRITNIVRQTYEFEYTFRELQERQLKAPITIFKAQGDDYSFLESGMEFSARPPTIVDLECDHYSLLKPEGIEELTQKLLEYNLIGESE
ncbi:amino acid adenylation domain-containing protein [Paraneptunicella aestuarii]|uniref:amino acid adenylation domain-containing protein n=1 Tax=Paraneptunicella aestuarii TaxID=2831148 RepID=UPI001E591760|nr:amino acid adenylation domain-containing protein [Paraneptunicella aestuarii]